MTELNPYYLGREPKIGQIKVLKDISKKILTKYCWYIFEYFLNILEILCIIISLASSQQFFVSVPDSLNLMRCYFFLAGVRSARPVPAAEEGQRAVCGLDERHGRRQQQTGCGLPHVSGWLVRRVLVRQEPGKNNFFLCLKIFAAQFL